MLSLSSVLDKRWSASATGLHASPVRFYPSGSSSYCTCELAYRLPRKVRCDYRRNLLSILTTSIGVLFSCDVHCPYCFIGPYLPTPLLFSLPLFCSYLFVCLTVSNSKSSHHTVFLSVLYNHLFKFHCAMCIKCIDSSQHEVVFKALAAMF